LRIRERRHLLESGDQEVGAFLEAIRSLDRTGCCERRSKRPRRPPRVAQLVDERLHQLIVERSIDNRLSAAASAYIGGSLYPAPTPRPQARTGSQAPGPTATSPKSAKPSSRRI
jgi:hypothetical protein